MWEISNTSQAVSFLYSIILGIIYALFYDFFRAVRIVKHHTAFSVFLQDLFYFFITAIVTFIYLLALTNGEIRAYVLVGILIGFLLFIFTISKYYIIALTFVLKLIFKFINLILKGFYIIIGKLDYLITIFLKNTLKCFKKGLKRLITLLYTNRKSI
ncbi:MAG: spore cortex biosynthesis protein YabQ [Clostridia bacterium]|nr:spore cortex biosynthesis protein YabQ [Clostridia bacterium]